MSYSNGQVQSQSHSTGKGEKGDLGPPGISFNLTDDGNFDLDKKRLTDVANPVEKKIQLQKGMSTVKILSKILLLIVKQKNLMLTQKIPNRILLLIVKLKRLMFFCEMEVKV